LLGGAGIVVLEAGEDVGLLVVPDGVMTDDMPLEVVETEEEDVSEDTEELGFEEVLVVEFAGQLYPLLGTALAAANPTMAARNKDVDACMMLLGRGVS